MPKTAKFETSVGTITAELYDKDAPATVANFEKLANSGFYDGVKFHRVIEDFVVQGGDPLSRDLPAGDRRIGSGGPGWMIKCETAGNPRKHAVGALSMAHAGKDTGGSQFFMVLSEANTKHLNGVHTVFGQITGGLDVMKKIKQSDSMTTVRVAWRPPRTTNTRHDHVPAPAAYVRPRSCVPRPHSWRHRGRRADLHDRSPYERALQRERGREGSVRRRESSRRGDT
jgi:peptidyl-prolyl cis-trans isomerase B (cyclophilin B)